MNMSEEIITVGVQNNGLMIYKKANVVGGFTYYTEENSPSDIGALPALDDSLISIEALEIILADMKKTLNNNQ